MKGRKGERKRGETEGKEGEKEGGGERGRGKGRGEREGWRGEGGERGGESRVLGGRPWEGEKTTSMGQTDAGREVQQQLQAVGRVQCGQQTAHR